MPCPPRWLLTALLVVAPVTARAAEAPVYQMVRCTKATPGKSDEYRDFTLATTGKAMQVRADEGNVHGWVFARSVIPAGADTTCDFMQVNVHRGFPPERSPIDPYFVKAGVKVTRTEWYAKLAEQSRLLRQELWRGIFQAGSIEKGNYFRVDYVKRASGRRDLAAFGGALAAVKKGALKGFQAQEIVFPGGSAHGYDARVISVFAEWNALGAQPALAVGRGEELVRSELFQVIEVVNPAAGTPGAAAGAGGGAAGATR